MKRLRICFVLALCLLAANDAEAAFMDGVKIGTGVSWTDSARFRMDSLTAGLHASADFAPISALEVSPFVEIAGGDGSMLTSGGMLSLSIGMRDYANHRLLLGVSGGTTRINGNRAPFYGGQVGYKFPVSERWGFFFLGEYFEADHREISGFTGRIGVVFGLHKRDKEGLFDF